MAIITKRRSEQQKRTDLAVTRLFCDHNTTQLDAYKKLCIPCQAKWREKYEYVETFEEAKDHWVTYINRQHRFHRDLRISISIEELERALPAVTFPRPGTSAMRLNGLWYTKIDSRYRDIILGQIRKHRRKQFMKIEGRKKKNLHRRANLQWPVYYD